MIISAELQENPLITKNNVRKINKFSKTPIIFIITKQAIKFNKNR
ncbi:30S ribosomal protein S6 [Rickettsia akari str. Hartford]|uniref:30S ribosomal protein S6 n=1 Tax=Rickettsia akari (strain Hartford) TaxID=293614 RepID=A8GLX5_RICAH|nr:hypothetical protein [Rickettsia akari]ABV74400.1 30S ribosomal protein S6 [Rickettsia akari str. Hartford]